MLTLLTHQGNAENAAINGRRATETSPDDDYNAPEHTYSYRDEVPVYANKVRAIKEELSSSSSFPLCPLVYLLALDDILRFS